MVSAHVYDVGKGSYSSDTKVADKNDTSLCWAASAANLLQYWQDTYYETHNSGVTPANGLNDNNYTGPTGTQYLAIYDEFLKACKDEGSLQTVGFTWWLLGKPTLTKLSEDDAAVFVSGSPEAGYYTDVFGTETTSCSTTTEYRKKSGNAAALMLAIDTALATAGQGVGLGIYKPVGAYLTAGHAITCWGYETDADGNLSAIYVTDSDDRYYGTTRLDVVVDAGGYIRLVSTDATSYHYGSSNPYLLGLSMSIATPTGTAVAASALPTDISDDGLVTQNTRLSTPVSRSSGVSVEKEVILSGVSGGGLALTAGEGATKIGFELQEGAMSSLCDLSGLSVSGFSGAGISNNAKLYINRAETVALAGNKDSGIITLSYLELKDCATVSLTGNSATDTGTGSVASGGAVNNSGSLYLCQNTDVNLAGNTVSAETAVGAGVYSFYALLNNNTSLTFAENVTTATAAACGGALTGVKYTELVSNDSLIFRDNKAEGTSQALGGAIEQAGYTSTSGTVGTTLIQNNGSVLFSGNQARSSAGMALGGAVFVAEEGGLVVEDTRTTPTQTVTFSGNSASGATSAGGAFCNFGTSYLESNQELTFSGNSAAIGSAVYSQGSMAISHNASVNVSNNVSAGTGAVLNAGTMEIAWNDAYVSTGNTTTSGKADADINNAGTLYLAAAAGKSITLSSGIVSKGITYVGRDADGTTGSGTVKIVDDKNIGSVLSVGSSQTYGGFVSCSVGASSITGLTSSYTPSVQGLGVVYNGSDTYSMTSLSLDGFTFGSNDGTQLELTNILLADDCSFTVGSSGVITLNSVHLTYTGTFKVVDDTATIDLSNLFHCTVTGSLDIEADRSTMGALQDSGCRYVTVTFGDDAVLGEGSDVSLNEAAVVSSEGGKTTFLLPEPTTATLSLLALAALAGRRRRG